MRELKWKIHEWNFNPTLEELQTVGPTRFCIMDVHRGTLVPFVAMRVGVAFTGTTPEARVGDGDVGDGSKNIGFMTEVMTAITVAGLKNGAGNYLVREDTSNGKLYTTDDVIYLYYTGVAPDTGHEVTKGQLSVIVVYAEIE